MRQTLLVFTFLLGMVFSNSCTNKPDDTVLETKTEFAGYKLDTAKHKLVEQYEAYYKIAPTWGQASHYASKRPDHTLYVVFGVVLILAFVALFYGRTTDASWLPKRLENTAILSAVLFILAISGTLFLTTHSSDIRWNNDKWVKQAVYDKAVNETGSTQPIWDSLEANHLIVGGSWK